MGGVICNANDRQKKPEKKKDDEIKNEMLDITDEKFNSPRKSQASNPTKFSSKNESKLEDASPNKVTLDTNLLVSKGTNSIKSNYKKAKVLGQGSFGIVYLVKHKLLNSSFAMKVIKKTNKSDKDDIIMNEINILRKMDHPKMNIY